MLKYAAGKPLLVYRAGVFEYCRVFLVCALHSSEEGVTSRGQSTRIELSSSVMHRWNETASSINFHTARFLFRRDRWKRSVWWRTRARWDGSGVLGTIA